MNIFRLFSKRGSTGIEVRCGMCSVVERFPEETRDTFILHTCDSDLLIRAREPDAEGRALDLFVVASRVGASEEERSAAVAGLFGVVGEGPIPGLEDLLWRLKYASGESWPPPELASRFGGSAPPQRIDVSNELEMILHRMKKIAVTRRECERAAEAVRPILEDKLARLMTDPLEPIED